MSTGARLLRHLALAATLLFCGHAAAGVEADAVPVLLVASQEMTDSGFAGTVVAVAFPQDTGPMGVVLNRPSGLTLGALFGTDRPELAELADPIGLGGPVEPDGLLFLFRAPEHPIKALPVVTDIYLSGDGTIFEQIAARRDPADRRRFFAGHATWAEGQLDREIRRGMWHVLPMDADTLLAEPDPGLWRRLLLQATSPSARATGRPPVPLAVVAPSPL